MFEFAKLRNWNLKQSGATGHGHRLAGKAQTFLGLANGAELGADVDDHDGLRLEIEGVLQDARQLALSVGQGLSASR